MKQKGLKAFENSEFGQVRTIFEDGKVLFCGSDVARALGYSNTRDAISKHCKGVVKRDTLTNGGEQETSFIPEGDVYRLIIRSKLPSAQRFEHWVFDEVLPTLRQTGSYVLQRPDSYMIDDPIERAKRWIEEAQERLALQAKVEADAPKVLFADAVATSKDSCLVGQLAKVLRQNGYDIGQNRLFDYLRNEGYLCKSGENRNMPTQRSIDAGWFEIKEGTLYNLDGTVRITRTPKVTNKGQIYFVNKFLKEDKHEVSSR
nr:MAG TPA: repressor domain protein [Caudoviricetes sp.]